MKLLDGHLNMYDFESQVSVELYHKDYKGAWDVQPVTIKWQVEFEMRSWGIKDISVYVPDQEVTLMFTIADQNGDEVEKEATFQLTDIKTNMGYDYNSMVSPSTLNIHDNKIEVEFF